MFRWRHVCQCVTCLCQPAYVSNHRIKCNSHGILKRLRRKFFNFFFLSLFCFVFLFLLDDINIFIDFVVHKYHTRRTDRIICLITRRHFCFYLVSVIRNDYFSFKVFPFCFHVMRRDVNRRLPTFSILVGYSIKNVTSTNAITIYSFINNENLFLANAFSFEGKKSLKIDIEIPI